MHWWCAGVRPYGRKFESRRFSLARFSSSVAGVLVLASLAACETESPLRCEEPVPLFAFYTAPDGSRTRTLLGADGNASGYETCAGGFVHRAKKVECLSLVPRVEDVGGRAGECTNDADCAALPHGFCKLPGGYLSGPSENHCVRGCVSDDECAEGQICRCGNPVGECVDASCSVDADCNGDELCRQVEEPDVCGGVIFGAFSCSSPNDECNSRHDCDGDQPCRSTNEGFRCGASAGGC
jgi:hypothetical protein